MVGEALSGRGRLIVVNFAVLVAMTLSDRSPGAPGGKSGAGVASMSFFTRRRRSKLLGSPAPEGWRELLERSVPVVRLLPADRLDHLLKLTRVFLDEKHFEGAGGLEVTDEVRLTIAAQACLLLLGLVEDIADARIYPLMDSIVVYPDEYIAPVEEYQLDGTVLDGTEKRSGESWGQGAIALSWEDVRAGAADTDDGDNVVFHEFAHQLDEETGESNGVPLLPSAEAYAEWARVMTREFEEFVEKVDRNRRVLLDDYAAEDPAEFFAVATEYFFERPRELKASHPDLYSQLRAYYSQDPASWRRSR
jgi:Mlc titration factor MtfA (ptsG expression regulator)